MIRLQIVIISGLLTLAVSESAGQRGISLIDPESRPVRLSALTQDRPAVIVFLHSGCPISQKYTQTLSGLAAAYPSVSFIGVFTRWEKAADMRSFRDRYGLDIPLLLDARHRLVRRLGATVTPEAFLLSASGEVRYRGAIDNWFFALGRHRPAATELYLRNAIEACLAGEVVKVRRTEPVGCIIEQK